MPLQLQYMPLILSQDQYLDNCQEKRKCEHWAEFHMNTTSLFCEMFSLGPPAPCTAACVPAAPPAAAAPPGAETRPVLPRPLSRSLCFISLSSSVCWKKRWCQLFHFQCTVCFDVLYIICVFCVVIQSMFANVRLQFTVRLLFDVIIPLGYKQTNVDMNLIQFCHRDFHTRFVSRWFYAQLHNCTKLKRYDD